MFNFKNLSQVIAMALALTVNFDAISQGVRPKNSGRPAPWIGNDLQGLPCRGAMIPFGPFDYLDRAKLSGELFIVEEYHLTKEILNLQQATTTTAINDIQYTLMAWPNHHKALEAAYRYRLLHRGEFPRDIYAPSPVECHFQRAINFAPKDPVPYMIYGTLLHEWKLYEDALKAFQIAYKLMPNDVITLYNVGLTMVELGMYEEAQEVAAQVYSTDFPLPGLMNKLAAAEKESKEQADEAEAVPEQEDAPEEGTSEEELSAKVSDPDESAPLANEGIDVSVVSQ